jgi:hypothetical protein
LEVLGLGGFFGVESPRAAARGWGGPEGWLGQPRDRAGGHQRRPNAILAALPPGFNLGKDVGKGTKGTWGIFGVLYTPCTGYMGVHTP